MNVLSAASQLLGRSGSGKPPVIIALESYYSAEQRMLFKRNWDPSKVVSAPIIVDPVNPSQNVAGKFEAWDAFAHEAGLLHKQLLRRLGFALLPDAGSSSSSNSSSSSSTSESSSKRPLGFGSSRRGSSSSRSSHASGMRNLGTDFVVEQAEVLRYLLEQNSTPLLCAALGRAATGYISPDVAGAPSDRGFVDDVDGVLANMTVPIKPNKKLTKSRKVHMWLQQLSPSN
jgi:hypothetical protein